MFSGEEEGLLGKAKLFIPFPQLDKSKNWGSFALMFVIGGILIAISIPFASVILLNPKPFCLLFSIGSATIIASMTQIMEIKSLFSKISSSLVIVIYLSSLMISLYAGVVYIGYFYTLIVIGIQVLSLLYLVISLFPGGKQGISLALNGIKNTFKQSKGSFLPL